jgi:quinol monooxygenase YgiN
MIAVIGEFRIPLEHASHALVAMARVIAASRAEPGCLAYSYAEDVLEKGLFRVSEAWVSREALSAHFATEHMRVWQQERADFGMSGRRVVAYQVAEEEVL